MQNYLVVSVVGSDRPGIVDELSQLITEYGGNINDSRMTVLGGEFAVIMLLSGTWDAIAKIENGLSRLAKKQELMLSLKRTTERNTQAATMQYGIEVVAMDHPGIVHEVARFFSRSNINIDDMHTSSYAAPHTGAPIFTMNITISVPSDVSIAVLRGEFFEMCDALNLDAIMGPIK